jgi:hypothetical protein
LFYDYFNMLIQHTQFRILERGYLSVLSQPNQIVETLKHAHVIMKCQWRPMLCYVE